MSLDYKPDSPAWWQEQIQQGLEWRKKQGREDRWNDIQCYYEHSFQDYLQPNFNLIYMLASSLVPSLVFQSPSIINTPRRPEYQYWASFFDSVDNWLIDETELTGILEEAVLQGFLFNTFAIKLGYDFADTMDPKKEIVFDRIPGVIDRTRRTNRPWFDLITPDRLVLAPGTKSMRNCRWAAISYTIPVTTMKKLGYKSIKPTHMPDEIAKLDGNQWTEDHGDSFGYVSFYEVHNADTREWFCIDTNGKIIKEKEVDPCQVDGLPLEVLSFNPGVSSIWGTPDSLYIETQMLEGNECRRDGRFQRKAAILKFLYDRDMLTKEDVEKFLSGPPTVAIGVQRPDDKSLSDCILPLQPHVNSEYLEMQKSYLNDAQLLSGTGPNQAGMFASGRRTKYEAQVVEERNLLRTGSRRQKMADAVANLGYKMNRLIINNWNAPIVAKVIGADAAMRWVRAVPSEFAELSSNLVTKVNVESMTPVSKDARRQEMIQVLQMLAKMPNVNVMPILQSFLSSFNWADVTQSLPEVQGSPMSMPDYQQQQEAMMRNKDTPQQRSDNLQGMSQAINKMPNTGA
jgi:hypothetical protein